MFENFCFTAVPNLEIHPGPPMYVDGSIYAAGNLYTATDALHFLDDVNFLGTHYTNYRPEDGRTGPTIADNGLDDNWAPSNPPRVGAEQRLLDTTIDRMDPRFVDDPISNDTDSDGNRNNDGYREIIEEKVAGQTDPLTDAEGNSERLAERADYRIYVNAANNVTIYKGLSATPLPVNNAEAVALLGALQTNRGLRDVREGDVVRTTVLDVSAVTTAANNNILQDTVGEATGDGTGADRDGITIYFRDTSQGTSVSTNVVSNSGTSTAKTSAKMRGLKLVKGAVLPDKGLTVVTSNTLYVQGDYNTGTTASLKPASNTATVYTPPVNKPSPVVAGYNRKNAAMAADAVNILSNSWDDANSLLAKSSRVASNTTINAVIVGGAVPSAGGKYSGGLENFVRFHETWNNKYLTVYGSFALLYNSAEAVKVWGGADYDPPNRRWFFDPNLADANPPGFGVARLYERGSFTTR
jgi:hypothetical protein